MFGDPKARIIRLDRTQKKRYVANAGQFTGAIMTRRNGGYATCPVAMPVCMWKRIFGEYNAGNAGK